MKNHFPGYFKKDESELKEIWETCIFMFDTNVLLNLYRYSDSTRDAMVDLIREFNNRIYLPYQAASEYNKNRIGVISEQNKLYRNFINNIKDIQNGIKKVKHPFLSPDLHEETEKVLDKVKTEMENKAEALQNFLSHDPVHLKISELFHEKITDPMSIEKLKSIYEEGKIRYENKIPPGYQDDDKHGVQKYGDLVVWKQVLEIAKIHQKDIILVTDDNKSDWWWLVDNNKNKKLGPRPELIKEIYEYAQVRFHMYSSERFVEYGMNSLGILDQEIINEIRDSVNKEKDEQSSQISSPLIEEIKKRILEIDEQIKKKNQEMIYQEVINKHPLSKMSFADKELRNIRRITFIEDVSKLKEYKIELENELRLLEGYNY